MSALPCIKQRDVSAGAWSEARTVVAWDSSSSFQQLTVSSSLPFGMVVLGFVTPSLAGAPHAGQSGGHSSAAALLPRLKCCSSKAALPGKALLAEWSRWESPPGCAGAARVASPSWAFSLAPHSV